MKIELYVLGVSILTLVLWFFDCIFRTVPTVLYFGYCSDSIVFWERFRQYCILGTVPTVMYFGNGSDSIVFWERFRQYCILGTVPTVLYFGNGSDSLLFWERFRQYCILGTVPTVLYFCFLGFHFNNTNNLCSIFLRKSALVCVYIWWHAFYWFLYITGIIKPDMLTT
jgi:hypothetical protein